MRLNGEVSSIATLMAAGTLSISSLITDDLIICFALSVLGAFGAMGLAKNTRHMIVEAFAGVCIGTGASFILLRMLIGSPWPELTALLLGIGGLAVPTVVRRNIGTWILEVKDRFFPKPKDPNKEIK